MVWIFECLDKSGRKIHLSKERWTHINEEHPEISPYLEDMQETLRIPDTITRFSMDKDVRYYYRFLKRRKHTANYLLLIVKYLNGEGFIITAYFVRSIK
jgi:hypothetical protein